MSTVINNYKFSNYKFTTEACYEEKNLDFEINLKGQAMHIICADGVTKEVADYLMNNLITKVKEMTENPNFSQFRYKVIYTYDKMFGFTTILVCDHELWYFIMGQMIGY